MEQELAAQGGGAARGGAGRGGTGRGAGGGGEWQNLRKDDFFSFTLDYCIPSLFLFL